MVTLDPEAAQLLRHAAQLAGARPVTLAELRRAHEEPAAAPLPPTRLRADAAVAEVVRRAGTLAEQRGCATVGRGDLLEALVEAEAVAAGLDLERLRFARWRLERVYGGPPRAREHRPESAVGS